MVQIQLPTPHGRQEADRNPRQPRANTAAARAVQAVALLLALGSPAAWSQNATLQGYAFREAGGGPPRRPILIELEQDGKIRYRETTREGGFFEFDKVAPGRYVLMPRFGTFVYGHEIVEVSAKGPNYAAVMLPKRTAGAVTGTVSFEDLSRRSNQRLQGRIRQANQLLKKGDFEAAAREYEKILATDPAAGLYDGLALVYLQLGRKEEAYRALENALSENPKFLLPYSHLGSLYVDDRKHSELALLAAQALHVDSTWAGGHLLMAEAQLRSRNFAAAIRHARTADDLMRGKSPDPHLLLARALWMQNECGPAQEHLTHFLQLRTTAGLLPEFSQVIGAIRACTS